MMQFLINLLISQNPEQLIGLFGLIGPIFSLMGTAMTNSTQSKIAGMQTAAQMDIANKNRASENMRQSLNLENKANTDLLDTQYRSNQAQTGVFQDLVGTMRDAFLRNPYIK